MTDFELAVLFASGISALGGFALSVLDVTGLRAPAERKLAAASVRMRTWAQALWSQVNLSSLPPHPNPFMRLGSAIGRGLFSAGPFLMIYYAVDIFINATEATELLVVLFLLLFSVPLAIMSILLAVANTLLLLTKFLQLTARGPSGTLGIIGMIVAVLGLGVFFYNVI